MSDVNLHSSPAASSARPLSVS